MATTFALTDGLTTVNLVYNPSSQTAYKLQYGAAINSGGVKPLWFTPDNFPAELVDLVDTTRQAFFTLDVKGADRDAVLNSVATLRRWVDGAGQQAARYWLESGATRRIDLRVQVDGSTTATLHPVIYGEIDDSGSHYTDFAELNKFAQQITVSLQLAPYGEAETDITLKNNLPSSPHMITDGDGDSIPDGVLDVGTPTTVLGVTTPSLTFDAALLVVVPATGTHGVSSETVTAAIGLPICGFADVKGGETGSEDPILIALRNGAGTTLATIEFDENAPVGYLATWPDAGGGANWYRYGISATVTAAADCDIAVYRSTLDATGSTAFYIDKWYLSVGTAGPGGAPTLPATGFVSSASMYNRNDHDATNPEYINTLDIIGVKGDTPALVRFDFTGVSLNSTGNGESIIAGLITETSQQVTTFTHWLEGEDATGSGTGPVPTFTTPADAARSGGAYARASGGSIAGVWSWTISDDDLQALSACAWVVYAVARASDADATLQLAMPTALNSVNVSGEAVGVTALNTWEPLFLGIINNVERTASGASGMDQQLAITVFTDGGTVDLDFICLFPAQKQDRNILLETELYTAWDTGGADVLSISGFDKMAFMDSIGTDIPDRLGGLWTVEPGIGSRLIFARIDSTNTWTLGDNWLTAVTVRARTRHLLGTT